MSLPARSWFRGLLLLLIVAAAFWPGLSGDFLFDDYPNIVSNPKVHAETLDIETLKRAAGAYTPDGLGRPLATLSFALDYYIGGKDPLGYKVTSLLVHLINCLLVFQLARRLIATAQGPNPTTWAPFALALGWAAHPLQVSTVLYIVQRMETLSLTFVLLALLAYLRGRALQVEGRNGTRWLWLCVPLVAFGAMAKETAVLFPVYCLALELTILGFGARDPGTSRRWRWAYAAGTGLALVLFFTVVLPHYAAPGAYVMRDFDLGSRLLTQLRALPMYLQWSLLPLPRMLHFYYDTFAPSRGLLHPASTLLGGLLLAGLLISAVAVRRKLPLFSLGVLWFFAAHLITSNVIPLELVFEHRNYFSLFGVLLAVTSLVIALPTRDGPRIKQVAVGCVLAASVFLTVIRAATWGDPFLLATQLVATNPQSVRASSDLATLYSGMSGSNPDSPFYDFAMREFARGAELPGASPLPEQGLILMAASAGKPVDPAWWDSIEDKLQRRPIGPQEIMAITGLARQRYDGIPMDEQRLADAYALMLSKQDLPAHLHAQYGDFVLTFLKDENEAARAFANVADRSVGDPAYVLRVAGSLAAEGHARQAAALLDRAIALGIVGPETPGLILPDTVDSIANPP